MCEEKVFSRNGQYDDTSSPVMIMAYVHNTLFPSTLEFQVSDFRNEAEPTHWKESTLSFDSRFDSRANSLERLGYWVTAVSFFPQRKHLKTCYKSQTRTNSAYNVNPINLATGFQSSAAYTIETVISRQNLLSAGVKLAGGLYFLSCKPALHKMYQHVNDLNIYIFRD